MGFAANAAISSPSWHDLNRDQIFQGFLHVTSPFLALPLHTHTTRPRKPSHAHETEHTTAQSATLPTTTQKSFMQPESSEVSQQANSVQITATDTPSTQHGLSRNEDGRAGLSLSDSPAGVSGSEPTTSDQSSEQIAADAAFAASLQQQLGDVRADTGRRLNTAEATPKKGSSTPSPPSGGVRIRQYENASTPPVRKHAGPGFEVIKKTRSPGDKRSAIQELPNGKLLAP